MRCALVSVVAAVALSLSSCGGETGVQTVTVDADDGADGVKRFAYREMKRQSAKTCAVIPRGVLAQGFGKASADPENHRKTMTDNDIALLFVEDVRIQKLPLQRAAYDGCLAGLRKQRR